MIKDLLQEGFVLKNKGHYKHAIEVFYKALELDNTSSELLLEIAELYHLLQNEEKALSYIEQILNKEPTHVKAMRLLKRIFMEKRAYAEAEQAAKNIYCISKDNDDLAEIFKLLNLQHKYDEIFEYKIEQSNLPVKLEQAKAYYLKKEFEKSEKILNDILQTNPKNQEALLLLGKVWYANDKKDLCISLLDKLNMDETNPELLNFFAQTEAYRGNLNKGINYLIQASKLDRSNDGYYFNLANIYYKQGDTYSAKKYYNLALSINPDNPNYHFALANLYYSEKHYKKALEELTEDFFEAKLLKAIILYDTGYLALAQKELKILAKERPENSIIQDYQYRIYEELKLN